MRVEPALQAIARRRIERGERLVEEQDLGLGGQRAREADALRLAARELVRTPLAKSRRIELDLLEQRVDARADARARPSRGAAA